MTISAEKRIPPAYRHKQLIFFASFIGLLLFAAVAVGDQPSDDVWLLSTRCTPRCGDLSQAAEHVRYWRMDDCCCMEPSDAEEFQADNKTPIVVYLHGNGTESDEAAMKGMYAYRSIRCAVGDGPFRFVIWSWPAGKVCLRIKNDIRLKAQYCNTESYLLASWLDGLPSGSRVGLVGHSFGPRIILGAAHLLAGGEVAGRRMSLEIADQWNAGKKGRLRAVLLAAAVDADCLAECGRRRLALSLLEKTLITQNACDRVLRFYPRLYCRRGPQAIGRVGPCCIDDPSKAQVVDVCCSVGKAHDWRCYCSSPDLVDYWADYVFFEGQSEMPQEQGL